MKVGDAVRLIGTPEGIPDGDAELPTKARFEQCLGHQFVISGFNSIGWAELEIAAVTGNPGESIWVETDFLALAKNEAAGEKPAG